MNPLPALDILALDILAFDVLAFDISVIDIGTLTFTGGTMAMVAAGLLAALAVQHRHEVDGIVCWAVGAALISAGGFLFLMQHEGLTFVSVFLPNTLVLAGFFLVGAGLRRFHGRPVGRVWWGVLAVNGAASATLLWFVMTGWPGLEGRMTAVGTGIVATAGYAVGSLPRPFVKTLAGGTIAGAVVALMGSAGLEVAAVWVVSGTGGSGLVYLSSLPVVLVLVQIAATITLLFALAFAVSRRLSEQKEALAKRSTQNYYEQILNQAPIDLAVFTPDAEYEHINPQSVSDPGMREWLGGRTNEDYFERKGRDLEVGQARDEAIRRAARRKETVEIEETIQTEDGFRHFLRVHSPLTNLNGKVVNVVAFGIDTTQLKKRERRLEKAKAEAEKAQAEAEEAQEEAEQAARLKSAMLANMSHEIRTPLTSIIGFAEAIGTELFELELPGGSPLPNHADLIEKSGRRLLETLEGILNLSKLEAGQMELSAETVDLSGQARRAAEELRAKAAEKGVDLELQAQSARAIADEGGVQIVVRNLLSNAIKYTDEGTVQVRTYQESGQGENSQEEGRKEESRKENGRAAATEAATEAAAAKAAAVLEVEDTGIGMDLEAAEILFEPFRQASEGLSREYEGTGIGLAVTREAVEQMGGTIEVETEKGEGTQVTVRLPLGGEAA